VSRGGRASRHPDMGKRDAHGGPVGL
jgi:hypothetical protein